MEGISILKVSQYLSISWRYLNILNTSQYLVTWSLLCLLRFCSSRLLARASNPLTPSSKLACWWSSFNLFSFFLLKFYTSGQRTKTCLWSSSGTHGLPRLRGGKLNFFGFLSSNSNLAGNTTTIQVTCGFIIIIMIIIMIKKIIIMIKKIFIMIKRSLLW